MNWTPRHTFSDGIVQDQYVLCVEDPYYMTIQRWPGEMSEADYDTFNVYFVSKFGYFDPETYNSDDKIFLPRSFRNLDDAKLYAEWFAQWLTVSEFGEYVYVTEEAHP